MTNIHGPYGCGTLPDGSYECECGHCGKSARTDCLPLPGDRNQGWPGVYAVLYTDSINGEQTCRDDLWMATTASIKTLIDDAQQGAYAEGRKDQAEDQPIPDAALKLLDECMFFCQQAMQPHMDQEDRQGMASGLHEQLREYLLDVGYIWKPKEAASADNES